MERENRWKGDDWRPDGWSERLPWKFLKEESGNQDKPGTPIEKSKPTVLKKKAFGRKKKTEL